MSRSTRRVDPKDVLSKEEIRKHLIESFNKREIDEASKVHTNNSGQIDINEFNRH